MLFFGDSTTPDVSTGGVAPDFDVLMRAVVGQFGQQLGTAIFQNGGTSGATLQQVLTDTVAGGRGITWVCSQDYDVIFIRYDINGIRVGGRNADRKSVV